MAYKQRCTFLFTFHPIRNLTIALFCLQNSQLLLATVRWVEFSAEHQGNSANLLWEWLSRWGQAHSIGRMEGKPSRRLSQFGSLNFTPYLPNSNAYFIVRFYLDTFPRIAKSGHRVLRRSVICTMNLCATWSLKTANLANHTMTM